MNTVSISIIVSDPWDVGEAVDWKPIRGQVLRMAPDQHGGLALVQFEMPITYRGARYRYAVASPRLEGHQVAELTEGKMLCAALTGISDEQAQSENALDTSNWRGGFAFVGDIEPAG